MTWHEGEPTDAAFREFRAALEPLELSGKLRGVLLQYHPRFMKSDAAKAELARAPGRLAPLVPLVEFRHRSWMDEAERGDTLAFLEAARARVRVARQPAHARVERLAAGRRGDPSRGIRPLPRAERADLEHPWRRAPPTASTGSTPRRSSPSGSSRSRASRSEAEEVYAMFNNNRDDFAPRSAQILRGLLDEAGVPAAGGVEPPPTELTLF